MPGSADRYLALFNASDVQSAQTISVEVSEIGLSGPCEVRDLWTHQDLGTQNKEISATLAPHASAFYRVHAKQ